MEKLKAKKAHFQNELETAKKGKALFYNLFEHAFPCMKKGP